MSITLDGVMASVDSDITAALSGGSVAVLLYALSRLETPDDWLDTSEDPLDEISTEDWDIIEKLIGKASSEIMTPFNPLLVGMGMLWFDNSIPSGWLVCNGQAVSRETYSELFDLWGVQFGAGNGTTTFNLPNLDGRSPMGVGATIGLANSMGELNHTLTVAELPAHSHRLRVGNGANAFQLIGGGGTNPTVGNGVTTSTTPINSGDTGSSNAHNNVHPVLGVHFIVYTGVDA